MNEYTEREQLAIAKQWFKDNGKYFIAVIGVTLITYGGWNYYQYSKQQRIEQTEVLYTQFSEALEDIVIKSSSAERQMVGATTVLNRLKDHYATNVRSILAALELASLEVQRNRLDVAREHLDWALSNVPDKGFEQLINYRLASVEYAQQKYHSALRRLSNPTASYTALFAELEGDILMAQSQYADALIAYEKAIESAEDQSKALLEVKIQLAIAKASS